MVIFFVDVFAVYLPALAILNVNVHVPVPIVNAVGLLSGVNVHEPFFDHVWRPPEFVEATFFRPIFLPATKDDTFHVTVVDVGGLMVIFFVDVFAGYSPDPAIFNFNVHVPVPIVSFVGLLFGVNVHEPFFDHVWAPGEFVVATSDKLLS